MRFEVKFDKLDPETRSRMQHKMEQGLAEQIRATLPGRLAAFIDQMMYDADNKDISKSPLSVDRRFVANSKSPLSVDRRFVANCEVYVGKDVPAFFGLNKETGYANTAQTMRAIMNYLEECAIQELLKK